MYKESPTILSKGRKLNKYFQGFTLRSKRLGFYQAMREFVQYNLFYMHLFKHNNLKLDLRTILVNASFYTKITRLNADIPKGEVINYIPPTVTTKVYKKNHVDISNVPTDKFQMYNDFIEFGIVVPKIYCVTDEKQKIIYGDFENYRNTLKENKVLAKSRYTHGGIGMELHEVAQKLKPNYIYQAYVKNHQKIIDTQKNNFSSTVRIAVYNDDGEAKIVGSYIRFNSGTVADHSSYGSICANINFKNGKIINDGYDKIGNRFKIHPESKTEFKNFQIPNWDSCLEVTDIICQNYKNLPLIGLDIIVTDEGYCLLEINAGFAVNELQKEAGLLKHDFVLKEYDLNKFSKYSEFVN